MPLSETVKALARDIFIARCGLREGVNIGEQEAVSAVQLATVFTGVLRRADNGKLLDRGTAE